MRGGSGFVGVRGITAMAAALMTGGCLSLSRPGGACMEGVIGIDGEAVRAELLALSQAWQDRAEPGADVARLEALVRADVINMTRYLHAQGACGATVTGAVAMVRNRPCLQFVVSGTNLYRVRQVTVTGFPAGITNQLAVTNTLPGQVAAFGRIRSEGRRLLGACQNAGYPGAALADMSVSLDHTQRLADVQYALQAGPPAVFGVWDVQGLRRVDRRYVARMVPWETGQVYRKRHVDLLVQRLGESGLFSYVDLGANAAAPTSGVYDVALRVRERKRRSVELGGGYQSDIGAQATVQWQHRNLLGMGQRLDVDAKYAEDEWLGHAEATWPRVFGTDHDVGVGLRGVEEDTDAYFVRYGLLGAALKQDVGRRSRLRYGPALKSSQTRQREEEDSFLQALFPVEFLLERRDDALDPRRGFALNGRVEPAQDLQDPERYVKAKVTPSAHVPLGGRSVVLSGRVTVGSIVGAARPVVPPDQRFYAGGGQSIRGYAYQSVGPREEGAPVGGESLLETSAELRLRFTKTLGAVVFVDGGSAYESEVTDFSESYQWGAGLGVRYFSVVGPVRADVGVPVNPRDDIDNAYEFYISVGQAF